MGVKHAPSKPVFLVTHPRAISTAFERVIYNPSTVGPYYVNINILLGILDPRT
jgi:hypothetical protein